MEHEDKTNITYGSNHQPTERVETGEDPLVVPVSTQLIQAVQEMPLSHAVFLYRASAPHTIASSRAAKAKFEPTEHVLDIFADSDSKTHIKRSEKSGHNLDDLTVQLQDNQGCATVSLRHITGYSLHVILLFLSDFKNPCEVEFDIGRLTPRERDIIELLGAGKSNEQIANLTGLTGGTVYNHISRILQKIGMSTRAQIVAKLRK